MNIKYIALILSMVALPLVSELRSQDEAKDSVKSPASLLKLRDSWQAARKRALDPIDKQYEGALKKMLVDFTRAGDLDSAVAVKTELEKLHKPVAEIEEGAPVSLTIIKAVFGSDEQRDAGKGDDVTAKVRGLIKEGKISVKVHRDIFGDPNPFGPKTLAVEYMKKGSKKILIKEVPVNELLTLP